MTQQAMASIASTISWRFCQQVLVVMIVIQVMAAIWIASIAPKTIGHSKFFSTESWLISSSSSQESLRRPKQVIHNKFNPWSINGNKGQQADLWELDTHDMPGAWTHNFVKERLRQTELFLHDARWNETAKMVQQHTGMSFESCFYYAGSRILFHEICHGDSGSNIRLVAFNRYGPIKTWCGISIPPGESILLPSNFESACKEPVEMLPITNHDNSHPHAPTPEVVLLANPSGSSLEWVDSCDIPCRISMHYCSEGKGDICLPEVTDFSVEGYPFTFQYRKVPMYQLPLTDRKAYRQHKYSVSRSFRSDIPLSTLDWKHVPRDVTAQKPDWKSVGAEPRIVYMQTTSQCESGISRGAAWADTIQKAFGNGNKLDSLGPCIRNKDPPKDMDMTKQENRQMLFGQYMFTLILEQSLEPDDISELLWEALWAGSIPVHVGASNIQDHTPFNSVISANMFNYDKQKLGAYLHKVSLDQALWSTFHAWRSDHNGWNLWKDKYSFLKTSPYCRMCRLVHAKRFGLRWNHTTQEIVQKSRQRGICLAKNAQVTGMVRESWITQTVMENRPRGNHEQCGAPSLNGTLTLDLDSHKIIRSIQVHSNTNVLDITIHSIESASTSGTLVLRLAFPTVRNERGAYFPNVHLALQNPTSDHKTIISSAALQDRFGAKVTVLASWKTKILTSTIGEGYLDVIVQNHGDDMISPEETKRVRVLLEDMDPLRDVSTEYSLSYFASILISDFLDPLELFYHAISS